MKEKISIIIPVYNCAAFLRQCLDSVLAQSYTNIEVLLVNDGSTDDSLEICKEYQQKDERVRFIDKPNGGVSDTRNLGVGSAEGEYIVFVDADDRIAEDVVECLYTAITTHQTDAVRCNYYSEGGRDGDLYTLADQKVVRENIKDILYHFVTNKENIPCYCWVLMIKKDKVPEFDTELFFMEDTLFFIKLLINIDSIYFLDKKLYYYRYNSNSASKDTHRVAHNISGMLTASDKIRGFLREQGATDAAFERRMDACMFSLVISKLKLLTHQPLVQLRRSLRDLCDLPRVRQMITNADLCEIPKKILPEYLLIRSRAYLCVALVLKVKKILKGEK